MNFSMPVHITCFLMRPHSVFNGKEQNIKPLSAFKRPFEAQSTQRNFSLTSWMHKNGPDLNPENMFFLVGLRSTACFVSPKGLVSRVAEMIPTMRARRTKPRVAKAI